MPDKRIREIKQYLDDHRSDSEEAVKAMIMDLDVILKGGMSFEEWRLDLTEFAKNRPEWRIGQVAFNSLCEVRPEIADRIRGNGALDPFYIDANIPAFAEFVRENWNG